jgi:hypothetical protein
MDDFSVFCDSFDDCLTNLKNVLNICEEKNFMLNWEKCHFMVKKRYCTWSHCFINRN